MVQTPCWDVKTTAAFLSCSEAHVYRMLRKRALPGVKIGRDWRVNSVRLRAMFEDEPHASAA